MHTHKNQEKKSRLGVFRHFVDDFDAERSEFADEQIGVAIRRRNPSHGTAACTAMFATLNGSRIVGTIGTLGTASIGTIDIIGRLKTDRVQMFRKAANRLGRIRLANLPT